MTLYNLNLDVPFAKEWYIGRTLYFDFGFVNHVYWYFFSKHLYAYEELPNEREILGKKFIEMFPTAIIIKDDGENCSDTFATPIQDDMKVFLTLCGDRAVFNK